MEFNLEEREYQRWKLDLFIYLSHTISLWEKLKYHFYVFAYHGDHHFDYRDDHIVIIIVINMITELSPPVGPCGRPLEHVVLATFQRHIHDGDLACPSQIYEHIDKNVNRQLF